VCDEGKGLMGMARKPGLVLFSDHSRKDVHDIFSPDTKFTQSSGTWGLHGIIEIPEHPGSFVFFVTLGQHQAGHAFDEWITEEGVISWQSQPRQSLEDRRIQQFIHHDDAKNTIYLFLRTQRTADYTYFGRLKYLAHDPKREKPVYMYWQLLDWPIPADVLNRINLKIQPANIFQQGILQVMEPSAKYNQGSTTFVWRGMKWQVNQQALLSQVRDRIARGLPAEATRYKDWFIEIDGQHISPKWLFHLITGAGYNEFDSPTARGNLAEVGLVAKPDQQEGGNLAEDDGKRLVNWAELNPRERQAALQRMTAWMSSEFPLYFEKAQFRQKNNGFSLEVHFDGTKFFYLMKFAPTSVEYSLLFPGKSQKALQIADQLNEYASSLSEKLEYVVTVVVNSWEPHGRLGFVMENSSNWVQLSLASYAALSGQPINNPRMTESKEKFGCNASELVYAQKLVDFIRETHELVANAMQPPPHKKSPQKVKNIHPRSVQALNAKIDHIHHLLAGEVPIPSDEVLCDWVHFCYDFGMYKEGQILFALVASDQVNPWYYERTKKLARLCSIKAITKD